MSADPREVEKGDKILANMIKAAAADAVVEKKLTQFKIALFGDNGPQFVRVVVMPEAMERNWPTGAPLGETSKEGGQ